MKRSGYQTIFHIYLIFFLVFVVMIFVVFFLFSNIITTKDSNHKTVRSDWAKNVTVEFSDYIIFVSDMPRVTQKGIELLQDNHIGMQILDAEGREIFEYQSPDIARELYSLTELLQLNQTAHLENENITTFIGTTTEKQKEYVYILHFPINVEKVTMYLSGDVFLGGKRLVTVIIGILFLTVIFLGIVYGFFITKTICKLEVSIHDISERCFFPVKEHGAFADLFSSLNELDATIKVSDKLQRETEQLRREWIANITHDLKTPLSPIKGYAEILQNDGEKANTEYRRCAGIMLKNVTYMEKLIDDLKLTWQLESDMIPIDRQEHNLVRFLRELSIDILNCPEYEERTILFEGPDEGISFSFDTKLFIRAFQNLIVNAFVHGNENTIVMLKIVMKDNCLDISVSDNGDGMKPEEAEKLFERYYRGTSTDNTAGTGLGLAIAKSIIELHNGIIDVSSAEGSGTTFCIHFLVD